MTVLEVWTPRIDNAMPPYRLLLDSAHGGVPHLTTAKAGNIT